MPLLTALSSALASARMSSTFGLPLLPLWAWRGDRAKAEGGAGRFCTCACVRVCELHARAAPAQQPRRARPRVRVRGALFREGAASCGPGGGAGRPLPAAEGAAPLDPPRVRWTPAPRREMRRGTKPPVHAGRTHFGAMNQQQHSLRGHSVERKADGAHLQHCTAIAGRHKRNKAIWNSFD